ncbi:MAG TPA: prephenate dehydrogenase/arogenate dehydrogenase family protein [Oxalicibacterium sp.]|uniref:prephenate dehydrogenase n=1 Tax=Oxalicibacterium sp. TaxID=2766525 RepID=UPI002BE6A84A|nr:prephenate dehydrogenase/arogenate dehydrogenase family protein [Oxalicibacterium sp.]HWU97419.1 prephenate dehydrogenase/arogenate dehydrogenase family protein [Oxalicibacterium sp.]
MLKKIVIFGVGLIGGSFAAGLRKAGAVEEIVGVGRTSASLTRAKELGLIDCISTSVEEALHDADLVLVAAPVAQTESILSAIKPWLQPQTVITDAGSIKGEVVAAAVRALGDRIAQFVPGHPIAGSEANGPDAALADLYVGKKVVLTPLPQNAPAHVERVAAAWQQCGALIHKLGVEEHDAVFAAVSHLPHLLAYALVDDIASKPHADLLFQYAASGFRDFTRIAGSSPEMWRDISLANQPAILNELDAYIAQLTRFRALLAQKDGAAMEAMFANAQRARNEWAHGGVHGGTQSMDAADAKSRQDRKS